MIDSAVPVSAEPRPTGGAPQTPKRQWPSPGRIVAAVFVTAGAVVFALVLVYAVTSAVKPPGEVLATPLRWLPSEWHFDNFLEPFRQTTFARYFMNSAFVAVSVTVLNILTCSMAGYSFAKFRYPGRMALFALVIATLMVPIEVIYVPLYDLVNRLGWINTYWGLIIPYGTNAFGIFLMRQSILSVPDELIEAARLDGASETHILFRIVLPLVRGPLAAVSLFIFMTNWDAFLWPLLVAAERDLHTLPVGLAAMQSSYSSSFSMLLAAAVLAMLPTLLLFLFLQRHFVAGIATSAGINK